jgi:hypothetical protein
MLIINKRNIWNIKEKVTLKQEIEFRKNNTAVCWEFGLVHYTIQKFGKNRIKIENEVF